MKKLINDWWSKHKLSIYVLEIVAIIYVIMMIMGITCPIKFFTGVSCPGCGMSRACISFLRLNFEASFYYHPMLLSLPVTAATLLFFRLKKKEKAYNITLYIFAFLMFAVYLYRLIWLDGEIVVFNPKSGAIFRGLNKLFGWFS